MKKTKNKLIRYFLDHGFVKLLNVSGPTRRVDADFDADSTDPANTARISFDQMDSGRSRESDLKLVAYLLKNRHSTPVEMIEVWFEMKMPIFLARQLIRHRTAGVNEVSARYTILPAEWYIPSMESIGIKSKTNKQGRDVAGGNWFASMLYRGFLSVNCWISYKMYKLFLLIGIAPELARAVLHLNHYTHWVWKHDLHNLLHLVRLRRHSHAQYEARELANCIYDLLCQELPEFMKVWQQQEEDAEVAAALLSDYKKAERLKKQEAVGMKATINLLSTIENAKHSTGGVCNEVSRPS